MGLFSPAYKKVFVNDKGMVANKKHYYKEPVVTSETPENTTRKPNPLVGSHYQRVTLVPDQNNNKIPAGEYKIQNKELLGDYDELIQIKLPNDQLLSFKNPWGNQNERLRRYGVSKEIYVLSELERILITEQHTCKHMKQRHLCGVCGGLGSVRINRNIQVGQQGETHRTTRTAANQMWEGNNWFRLLKESKRYYSQWDMNTNGLTCAGEKPDYLIRVNSYALVLEIDEDQHRDPRNYGEAKEIRRLQKIHSAGRNLGISSMGFLRFNPDEYLCSDTQVKIKGMFKLSRKSNGDKKCEAIPEEFTKRMVVLVDCVNDMVNRKLEGVHFLYYDKNREYGDKVTFKKGRVQAVGVGVGRETRASNDPDFVNSMTGYEGRDQMFLPNEYLNQTPLRPHYLDLAQDELNAAEVLSNLMSN